MPNCFICVAEADRTLCALNRVVSVPALFMVNSSHFAKVGGWTAWNVLVFAINSLTGSPPSALVKYDRLSVVLVVYLTKQEIKESGELTVPPGHLISPRSWPGRLVFSMHTRVKTTSPSMT